MSHSPLSASTTSLNANTSSTSTPSHSPHMTATKRTSSLANFQVFQNQSKDVSRTSSPKFRQRAQTEVTGEEDLLKKMEELNQKITPVERAVEILKKRISISGASTLPLPPPSAASKTNPTPSLVKGFYPSTFSLGPAATTSSSSSSGSVIFDSSISFATPTATSPSTRPIPPRQPYNKPLPPRPKSMDSSFFQNLLGRAPTSSSSSKSSNLMAEAAGLFHLIEEVTDSDEADDDDPVMALVRGLERQNQRLSADPKNVQLCENSIKAGTETLISLVNIETSTEKDQGPKNSSRSTSTTTTERFVNVGFEDDATVAPERIGGWARDENSASSDLDFWNSVIENYQAVQQKFAHLLARKIRGGIPRAVRGRVWQAMLGSNGTGLESKYRKLALEKSQYSKIIQRDLARTFPQVPLFSENGGEGQRALGRVMRAYSVYDTEVGYCQGLGFLVGPLLMNMTENESFCAFVKVMEFYNVRSMFLPSMRGLHIRLFQLSGMIATCLPDINAHFNKFSIPTALYASHWFLTLFAYTYPLRFVLRVWDIALSDGWDETVLRVALALISRNRSKILASGEFEEIVTLLTKELCLQGEDGPDGIVGGVIDMEGVLEDACQIWSRFVTKDRIAQLEREYEAEEGKKLLQKAAAAAATAVKRPSLSSKV